MDIETFFYAKRLADSIDHFEDVIKDYQEIIDNCDDKTIEFPIKVCVEDRSYFYMRVSDFEKFIMEYLKQELKKQKKAFEAI